MNTLAYGLLSLLSASPRYGYDLMRQIQLFWPANHSQIYPALARLEKHGYVSHEIVPQPDKPDKKVYTITSQGEQVLKKWIGKPTAEPNLRDEFKLKAYALGVADPEQAQRLFAEREEWYLQRLAHLTDKLEALAARAPDELDNLAADTLEFRQYMLIRKAIADAQAGLDWCRWVMAAYAKVGRKS